VVAKSQVGRQDNLTSGGQAQTRIARPDLSLAKLVQPIFTPIISTILNLTRARFALSGLSLFILALLSLALPWQAAMAQIPYDPTTDLGTGQPVPRQSAAPVSTTAPAPLSAAPAPVPVQVAPQVMPQLAPIPHVKRTFPAPSGAPLSSGLDSTTLRTGTNSTTLQTGTDSTTLQTGTNNTTLQVGTQSTTLQVGTASALLKTGVERQVEQVNILFIVDGSRSMLEKLEPNVQKIDAAKQVLQQALSRIPSDINLGLRVFGQGYNGAGGGTNLFSGGMADMQSECRNTALWVPIGKGNRRAIIEKVRGLQPYGMTPLAYSIAQAAFSDFRACQGSKVIILITDGADTCGGDPCKVIQQLLPKYGIKIKVDVVGLSLHREPQARDELNCVAQSSGGKYFDAKTAADLIDSVSASVSKAIEGRVIVRPSMDPSGQKSDANPINTQTPQDNTPPVERLPQVVFPH